MKISDKLALIDKIGRTLQAKFGYVEIDLFLKEFGVSPPVNWQGSNSKWLYAKAAISGISTEVVLKIAEELDLRPTLGTTLYSSPPKNWENTKDFRLFISHLAKEKLKATRLRDCLIEHGISSFVAHEDIHPTQPWQREIESALATMDAFVSIHTPGFKDSYWAQQEVGYALERGVKMIALRFGEDPLGFIAKDQALATGGKKAEQVSSDIVKILSHDERTKSKLAGADPFAKSITDEVPF